jgi:hypothetical protein
VTNNKMVCNPKSLDNLNSNLPSPSNPPGTNGQLIISDGNEGTLYSTSLLGQEAAVLSAFVAEAYSVPVGGFTVPGNTPSLRLETGVLDSGKVVLGLDGSATTNRAFSIFNPFTGANNTNQKILVSVHYSVNFTGANTGECGVWVQIVGADLVVKTPRYGAINQQNISVANGGNAMNGGTVIGLEVGEAAAFFVKNTAGSSQVMIGDDDITMNNLVTKFQSALIN